MEEADFVQRVQLALLRHRVLSSRLELGVTESAVMENAEQALEQLKALSEAGIRLAIDDFGTGYSSMSYLQRLPAHVVKIDRSFVMDLAENERNQALVRSMATLSRDLGYRVVAEGVETAASVALLSGMACDEAQGYHFARPLEAADFERWMGAAEAAALTAAVAA